MQIVKLDTQQEVDRVLGNWDYSYAVLDTETTSLNIHEARVISFTLAVPSGDLVYFIRGDYLRSLKLLKCPFVCHNFKYDFAVVYHNGIDLRQQGLLDDTMLLDHLLNEENEHNLDAIIKRYFKDNYKEVFWNKYENIQDATEEDLVQYSGKDAGYTAKVYLKQCQELQVPASLIVYNRQFALSLYDTEITGLSVDLPYLHKTGDELGLKIANLTQRMRSEVDLECSEIELEIFEVELDKRKTIKGKLGVTKPLFNFNSNNQMCNLLYDKLELPEQKNKAGNRSIDDNSLENLVGKHPIISFLREYKGHSKVKSSFIDGTLEQLKGSRIYPSFNVNGTVTGRTSSSEPNMQQLPSDGGIRGIYIPDKDHVFLSYDYSQLEVTIAAHFSQDKNLLRIIHEGVSQHDITAEGLKIPRATAKTINFALQYGAGKHKIRKILGCSDQEAEETLNRYWETYKGLREFILSVHQKIERGEPLVNLFGRRRHLPTLDQVKAQYGNEGWYSKQEDRRVYRWEIVWQGVLRQGPNSIIQGTGADITNWAFMEVDDKLREHCLGKGLFVVHDEILAQVHKDYVAEAEQIMKYEMLEVGKMIGLTVPLKVEGSGAMSRWND